MKNINLNKKISLGLFLISVSFILRYLSPDHTISAIAFFQGFTTGLGLVMLIAGTIQKRNSFR